MGLGKRAGILSWSLTCLIYLNPQSGQNVIFAQDLIVLRAHSPPLTAHPHKWEKVGLPSADYQRNGSSSKQICPGPPVPCLTSSLTMFFHSPSTTLTLASLIFKEHSRHFPTPFVFAVPSTWGSQESIWLVPSSPPSLYSKITF